MKDKNAILIGFVSSALDYLKSTDDEVDSDFKSKDLEKIRGDLTDRLNSLLYCADTDSLNLIDAGREAFGDFVVEKKKSLIDEFADLFAEVNSADKQKDITDRLEKLLNEPEEENTDLSYLFPDFSEEAVKDVNDELVSEICEHVETNTSQATEIDAIFSEIVAHEKVDPIFNKGLACELVNDSLVENILNDEDILAKEPEELKIERKPLYQLPLVRKDDRSFDDIYNEICELDLNATAVVDEVRELLNIPEPKMWVEPVKCQKFVVPGIKRTQLTAEQLWQQVIATVEDFSAVIDEEYHIQGIPEPKMWVEPVKCQKFVVPGIKRTQLTAEQLWQQVIATVEDFSAVINEEYHIQGIPEPKMWIEPVKCQKFVVPGIKRTQLTAEQLWQQVIATVEDFSVVINEEYRIQGIPEPKMWIEPVKCQKFVVPGIKRTQLTTEKLWQQVIATVEDFSAVINEEYHIQGIPEPKMWIEPLKRIPFELPVIRKSDTSALAIWQAVEATGEDLARIIDEERLVLGIAEPKLYEEPVAAKATLELPLVKKDDRSALQLYDLVAELAAALANIVDEERSVLNIPQPTMWQEPEKEVLTYTYITNPGLEYLEEQPEAEAVNIGAIAEEIDSILTEYLQFEEQMSESLRRDALKKVDPDTYIDNLISEVKVSGVQYDRSQSVFDSLRAMFPYLKEAFIRAVYDLKDNIANEYPFNKRMILLHRLVFKDVEKLRSFVEIMLDHAYQVNVDEKQMIVDVFKEMVNSDGLILSNIFEIANQAAFLDGEFEGYRVIAMD